jgi:KRAB domain-containing zinc finger protein
MSGIHIDYKENLLIVDEYVEEPETKMNTIPNNSKHAIKRNFVTPSEERTKSYKCELCSFKSCDSFEALEHLKIAHDFKIKVNKDDGEYQKLKAENKAQRPLKCERDVKNIPPRSKLQCTECSFTNYKPYNIKRHKMNVHDKIKRPRSSTAPNHAQTLLCTECEFKTHKSYNLKRHKINVHEKPKTYKCPDCDYGTSESSRLDRHIKAVHHQLKDFLCSQCEFQTSRNEDLKAHVKEKHLNEFRWECDLCGYKGKRGSSSKQLHHQTRHLGMKPHKCESCDSKFADRRSMRKHFIAKHSGEKPFMCSECGFAASWKSSLDRHRHRDGTWVPPEELNMERDENSEKEALVKRESSLKMKDQRKSKENVVREEMKIPQCFECEKTFRQRRSLKDHLIKIHRLSRDDEYFSSSNFTTLTHYWQYSIDGEEKDYNSKKFKCEKCFYGTNNNVHLKDHINAVHEKLRPYVCDHCDFAGAKKVNLATHIKRKHKDVEDTVPAVDQDCVLSNDTENISEKEFISSLDEQNLALSNDGENISDTESISTSEKDNAFLDELLNDEL